MEVSPLPTPSAEDWSEQFAATLQVQRLRVREFLSSQQERLRRVETDLSEQLRQIAIEVADDRRQTLQARGELAQRCERMEHQAEVLEQMKKDLAARQAEWENLYHRVIEQQQSFADQLRQQQDEFAHRQQNLLQQQSAAVAAENHLILERRKMGSDLAELESRRTELNTLQNSLQTRQAELEKRQQELIALTAETESQRRLIAREFKTRHAAHLKELDRKRIELEQKAEVKHSELLRQIESLKEECRVLKSNPQPAGNVVDRGEVSRLEAEKKDLAARLSDLEKQLGETRQILADAQTNRREDKQDDNEDNDDIRRRYETVVEELRELKALNEELQEQLARSRQSNGGTASQISSSVLNWEAEKQRILAALESDYDEENQEDREEKIKIEEVIHRTDRILAEKNREIGELRELLKSQTNNIGSMAVGAAALGAILDKDMIIQEERNNLARLQEEWRDKLRQAEIENSLERAKIARERSQLEERLRALQKQGVDLTAASEEKEPSKPTRGRWLAQLGLKKSEDDQN